jgi:hypothetical protein
MHSSACRADERYFLYDQDRIEVIFVDTCALLELVSHDPCQIMGTVIRQRMASLRVSCPFSISRGIHIEVGSQALESRVFTRADVIPIHVFVRWSSKRTCGDGARRGPTRGNLDPYVESGKPNNECLLEKIGTCGTRRPCCRRSICLHIDHDPQTRMKQNLGSMIER